MARDRGNAIIHLPIRTLERTRNHRAEASQAGCKIPAIRGKPFDRPHDRDSRGITGGQQCLASSLRNDLHLPFDHVQFIRAVRGRFDGKLRAGIHRCEFGRGDRQAAASPTPIKKSAAAGEVKRVLREKRDVRRPFDHGGHRGLQRNAGAALAQMQPAATRHTSRAAKII